MKAQISLATTALLLALGTAHASPWTFKAGVGQVRPDASHGSLDLDVSNEVGLTGTIEYQWAQNANLSTELLLALPFTHDVTLGGNKVAEVTHLPPVLSLKYSFPSPTGWTPYAGVGVNYTLIYDEKTQGVLSGKTLKADDSVGLAGLVGIGYQMPKSPWGVALDVRYINIKSDLKINGADSGTLKINPTVVSLSATYKY